MVGDLKDEKITETWEIVAAGSGLSEWLGCSPILDGWSSTNLGALTAWPALEGPEQCPKRGTQGARPEPGTEPKPGGPQGTMHLAQSHEQGLPLSRSAEPRKKHRWNSNDAPGRNENRNKTLQEQPNGQS